MITLTIPRKKHQRREITETKPDLDIDSEANRSVSLDCYIRSPPVQDFPFFVFIRPSEVSIENLLFSNAKLLNENAFSNTTTGEVNKAFSRLLTEREVKYAPPIEFEDRVYVYGFEREYEEPVNQAVMQLKIEYGGGI